MDTLSNNCYSKQRLRSAKLSRKDKRKYYSLKGSVWGWVTACSISYNPAQARLMKIDRPLVIAIQKDLQEFLEQLKDKHNLDSGFSVNGSYSNSSISFKVKYVSLKSVISNTPPPLNLPPAQQTKHALLLSNLGLPVNALGKCVKFRNELYRIIGVNNKPKNKIDLLTREGKFSRCTVSMIQDSFNRHGILEV